MLAAAAGLMPDSDADLRQTVAKLDGVSVHVLRFAADGQADPTQVEAIRDAYHLRGWKHVLSSTNLGGAGRSDITDVWLVLDGANVRGGVVLVESPKSLTLATVSGNLSPVDILRLRGHFGIPRFDSDGIDSDDNRPARLLLDRRLPAGNIGCANQFAPNTSAIAARLAFSSARMTML